MTEKQEDAVAKVSLAGVIAISVGFGLIYGFPVGLIVFGVLCLAYVVWSVSF